MALTIPEDPPLQYPPTRSVRSQVEGYLRGSGGWIAPRPHFVWRTGYPCDHIEEISPIGSRSSTKARAGVVRYASGFTPDLYIATTVSEWGVGIWGYVGTGADTNYYVQLPAGGGYGSTSLWDSANGGWAEMTVQGGSSFNLGFANNGESNYLLAADPGVAAVRLWAEGVYGALYSTVGQTDLHGYAGDGDAGFYMSANANSGNTGLDLVSGNKAIVINTRELPDGLVAMFREIENCEGQKALVLMTAWYGGDNPPSGGSGPAPSVPGAGEPTPGSSESVGGGGEFGGGGSSGSWPVGGGISFGPSQPLD